LPRPSRCWSGNAERAQKTRAHLWEGFTKKEGSDAVASAYHTLNVEFTDFVFLGSQEAIQLIPADNNRRIQWLLAHRAQDVGRTARWYGKDQQRCQQAFERALELLDLTIADGLWQGRRKELTRARELLCDAMSGGHTYGSAFTSLDRYFFHFAMAARAGG